jgi:tetratricopeptide (TPR) repeat protein
MDRIEVFKRMAAQDPTNILARYGLAMEHVNLGAFEEAIQWFRATLEVNPNYAAAYFHGGQTCEKLGDLDAARDFYRQGIEVTMRTGDGHTRAELQGALDLLPE